jgi:hypothetical protein
LRDLHEPRLDRVGQPEVADRPGEDPIRLLAGAREVERRCREIEAEVDPPLAMDAVEPVDPDRRLADELFLALLVQPMTLCTTTRYGTP